MNVSLLAEQASGAPSTVILTVGSAAMGLAAAAYGLWSTTRVSDRRAEEQEKKAADLYAAAAESSKQAAQRRMLLIEQRRLPQEPDLGSEDRIVFGKGSFDASMQVAQIDVAISEHLRSQAELYKDHIKGAAAQNSSLRKLSLWLIAIGAIGVLVGAGVALFGAIDAGLFTAVCGTLPAVLGGVAFNRADAAEKVAAAQFEHLNRSVTETARLRQALGIVETLKDPKQREYVLSTIALTLALQASQGVDAAQSPDLVRAALDGRPEIQLPSA